MYVRGNVCGILDVVEFEINEVIKMINITVWMQKFLQILNETFRDRVWFVGLQGSYGRDEATETREIILLPRLMLRSFAIGPSS